MSFCFAFLWDSQALQKITFLLFVRLARIAIIFSRNAIFVRHTSIATELETRLTVIIKSKNELFRRWRRVLNVDISCLNGSALLRFSDPSDLSLLVRREAKLYLARSLTVIPEGGPFSVKNTVHIQEFKMVILPTKSTFHLRFLLNFPLPFILPLPALSSNF